MGGQSSETEASKRETRKVVEIPAIMVIDLETSPVEIVDISYSGCSVRSSVEPKNGTFVTLIVPGLGKISARVRWGKADRIGLHFSVAPATTAMTKRRRDRLDLEANIALRRGGRAPFMTKLHDLSSTGCKVAFVDRPSVGETIWVRLDGLEQLPGVVRWANGFMGGVEFERPIHEAVFDLLQLRLEGGGRDPT